MVAHHAQQEPLLSAQEFAHSIAGEHEMSTHRATAQTSGCHLLTTTYPRVLPASLPRVSEPERNHGESLVLPGLDVLPAPELLFNFDLGKNQKVEKSQNSPNIPRNKPGIPGLTTLGPVVVKYQPNNSLTTVTEMDTSDQRANLAISSLITIQFLFEIVFTV